MGFWQGIMIGLIIGFVAFGICLFKSCSGALNKEWEAYREGYNDGINSVIKKENE